MEEEQILSPVNYFRHKMKKQIIITHYLHVRRDEEAGSCNTIPKCNMRWRSRYKTQYLQVIYEMEYGIL